MFTLQHTAKSQKSVWRQVVYKNTDDSFKYLLYMYNSITLISHCMHSSCDRLTIYLNSPNLPFKGNLWPDKNCLKWYGLICLCFYTNSYRFIN